jgi:hypothetical protein
MRECNDGDVQERFTIFEHSHHDFITYPHYDVSMMIERPKGGDTMTPKALAEELQVDPKRLRAFLRANFARPAEAKNTSWAIAPEAIEAAREKFAPKPEAK